MGRSPQPSLSLHYEGPAADAVVRSALTLTLTLLTVDSGANVAAALRMGGQVHSSLSWLLGAVARTVPDIDPATSSMLAGSIPADRAGGLLPG